MILPDANLLLYAYDTGSPHHQSAKAWLQQALSGEDGVALTWQVLLAFFRIGTDARVFSKPHSPKEAAENISELLAHNNVTVVGETSGHWVVLRDLISSSGVRGPHIMNANLAAIAIEHGAILCSADHDFARFPRLKWMNPLPG